MCILYCNVSALLQAISVLFTLQFITTILEYCDTSTFNINVKIKVKTEMASKIIMRQTKCEVRKRSFEIKFICNKLYTHETYRALSGRQIL